MNNRDLRVVKTRANIKTVFCEMLKKEPVEKISVTELSRQAKINKSTFYLHYQDIYELYNEIRDEFLQKVVQSMNYCRFFLTDSEKFLNRVFDTLRKNWDEIDFLWPKHDIFLFQPNLNNRIIERIYKDCKIEKNARNDMALETIIESAFRLSYTHTEKELGIITEILLSMIHAFFPGDDPALSDSDS